MKKLIKLYVLITTVSINAYAQTANPAIQKISPAAALLFKEVKTKLTNTEKNYIVQKSNLNLSADKKKFVLQDDPESNYSVDVYPVDLNKDGKEEIFVIENSGFFGQSGVQFILFIKDAKGTYQSAANVLGMPMILTTSNLGYPDLMIGGPGMKQPVWKYNGKTYVFNHSTKENVKTMEVEEASKAYMDTLR